ncbi:MFS transporter [Saccharomonospora sp. NB11]|uniref:MFS transporter n=1 Tax=Saccharomonospora sp. NB11 TaxID=1642298 RepID=UPI0018D1C352|nr:MFS transporter [Saccharomonospora sp. NB11]
MRRLRWWALLSDSVPFYPLYALWFADVGLSDARISALFVVWSVVGVLAEVPSGAVADRFSRRGAMAAGGLAQAAAYTVWIGWPGFWGFALGFAAWGVGGALVSGAVEALLHDGLTAAGRADRFGRVYGQLDALELVANVPAAVAATALFGLGGFPLVAWASVAVCVAAALLAAAMPEAPRATSAASDSSATYVGVMRQGAVAALTDPVVRGAVLVVAALGALDAVEEYFGLLAHDWGVPTRWVAPVLLGLALAGASGALLAGHLVAVRAATLTAWYAAAVGVLAAMCVLAVPGGLVGVALFYAAYRAVLVVATTWLQRRIDDPARATVTSFVGAGTELSALLVYAAWATGGVLAVVGVAASITVLLPWGLRRSERG